MSFNPGENVGPYRIIEQLGQGGMATVYKAYHPALDRYVALKVLHPAFNEDPNFEMRFQREARVVARLEHPHIVPVYDYAEHDKRPYLVMKYIEGETLKARLARGPLTSKEIQTVVDSVGSALHYAHQQGILHRDIKPSNVLITPDGSMFLADFGLARIAQAGESTLSSDSIMGTPQYISPEQAMGKKELDAGTDIYSFGVMLYEMVVGQVPFNADTPFSIIHDHIYSPLPMPHDINPKVPETVQQVLLKTLAKERADRYESIDDMVRAFKEAWTEAGVPMQGTGLTLPKTALKPEAVKPKPVEKAEGQKATVAMKKEAIPGTAKKRPKWPLIAGGVVVLLCLCVGALAVLDRNSKRAGQPTEPSVVIVATTTTGAEPVDLPTSAPATEAPVSPEIAAAREQVQANPNDPAAHLSLAILFWEAGQPRPAFEALNQAGELAKQDREFLKHAALEFSSRQAWVPAASMYVRLARTYPANEPLPEDVYNGLHESVYMAAPRLEDRALGLTRTFESIEGIDRPLGLVARARSELFNDSIEDARRHLNEVRLDKPDYPEAVLLEAEIMAKEGRIDEARQVYAIVMSDLSNAEWLRNLAGELMKELPL